MTIFLAEKNLDHGRMFSRREGWVKIDRYDRSSRERHSAITDYRKNSMSFFLSLP
jgi:hypothetical protein